MIYAELISIFDRSISPQSLPPRGSQGFLRIPKSKPSASGFDLDKEEGADEYAAWGNAASEMQLASSDAAATEGVMRGCVLRKGDIERRGGGASYLSLAVAQLQVQLPQSATPTAPSGREPRISPYPQIKAQRSGFDLDKEEGADEYAAWGNAASEMQLASSDAAATEGVMRSHILRRYIEGAERHPMFVGAFPLGLSALFKGFFQFFHHGGTVKARIIFIVPE